MSLPESDRQDIIGVLAEAMRLPPVLKVTHQGGDEHNMWSRNGDPLLADTEDEFYHILVNTAQERLADVFVALDLPTEGISMEKAFTDEFRAFESLQKSKNNGKHQISDLINANRGKREKFLQYIQDMNPFSKQQLKKLDNLLKKRIPKYAKIAEDFAVRAGFLGKIRNQAERENFETLGALLDRFPETIQASEKQGMVLTLREKEKAEAQGRKVKILPLTPQETRAVKHAEQSCASKITEVDQRQMDGIKQLVLRAQKERWSAQKLAQELFDLYGDQNRDWRRVAITELSMATNDAYLTGLAEGETVIVPHVEGTCKHCANLLEGKEFKVLANPPERETYDTDMNYVWAGKSNFGRRTAEWRPCLPLHPCCRHRAVRLSRFYKIQDGKTVLKTTAELINEERAKRGMAPDPNMIEGGSEEERLKKMSADFLKKFGGGQ